MKLIYGITTAMLLFGFYATGQESTPFDAEPIATDRPDQTESPSIVPARMFQMETGFGFEKSNAGSKTWLLPTTLIKYGVNDNFELRLITEFVFDESGGENTSGVNPVLLGFKAALAQEKGIWPQTAIIGHLALPNVASIPYKLAYYAPEFRLTMQHTLSDKLRLGYNLGAEWDGETPEPTFIYTCTAGFDFSRQLGGYIEIFGFAPHQSTAYHSLDGGFTYLVSHNFMVDVSAGFGLTEFAPDYYTALGFSFRI